MRWLLLLLIASSPFAFAHRNDGSNYSGHDASLCAYADGITAGSIACGDPLANPCYSGRSTSAHTPRVGSHQHAGFPAGKESTDACLAYQRANPRDTHCDDRHCIDPEDDRILWKHSASNHDCSVCVDEKCGWTGDAGTWSWHRHEGLCPDSGTNPPAETCECCEGVTVTRDEGRTCEQECESLLEQIPDACPVIGDPDDPPNLGEDEMGCHDNPPHPHHNGCPGPNVSPPGHNCSSLSYHRHTDAFEDECHAVEFEHDVVGCGLRMHRHDGHECHNEGIDHSGSGGGPGGGSGGGSGGGPGGGGGSGTVTPAPDCRPGLAYVCEDRTVVCSPLLCDPLEQASFACPNGVRLWNEQCPESMSPCKRGWRYVE